MSRIERRAERGQATVEFVFGLITLLAIVCLLYQVLHFEVDVFNKLNKGRRDAFRIAKTDQENTEYSYFDTTIEFTALGDLPMELPLVVDQDENLKYGPIKYRMMKGTQYYDPFSYNEWLGLHEWGWWTALATTTHLYQTKDLFAGILGIDIPSFNLGIVNIEIGFGPLFVEFDEYENVFNYGGLPGNM